MIRPIGTVKIDNAGRVLIPKHIRDAMDLEFGDGVDLFLDRDKMYFRKYIQGCALCGGEEKLIVYRDRPVCEECIKIMGVLKNER